jgi:hypothetical protein
MRAAMPGGAVRGASVRGVARGQSIAALSARGVTGAVRARVAAKMLQRRGAVIRRAGEHVIPKRVPLSAPPFAPEVATSSPSAPSAFAPLGVNLQPKTDNA